MNDYESISFTLRYHGGPLDGHEVISPRPLDRITHSDGTQYAAKEEGPSCLVWLSDSKRAIDLYYVCKVDPPNVSISDELAAVLAKYAPKDEPNAK